MLFGLTRVKRRITGRARPAERRKTLPMERAGAFARRAERWARAVAGIGGEAIGRESVPQPPIRRSRTTLATIEAAAIEAIVASPFTKASTAQGRGGGSLPSTSAMSGVQGRAASARRMASSEAWRMLMVSISVVRDRARCRPATVARISAKAPRAAPPSGPSNRRARPERASDRAPRRPRRPARRAARGRPRRGPRCSDSPRLGGRARARGRGRVWSGGANRCVHGVDRTLTRRASVTLRQNSASCPVSFAGGVNRSVRSFSAPLVEAEARGRGLEAPADHPGEGADAGLPRRPSGVVILAAARSPGAARRRGGACPDSARPASRA